MMGSNGTSKSLIFLFAVAILIETEDASDKKQCCEIVVELFSVSFHGLLMSSYRNRKL